MQRGFPQQGVPRDGIHIQEELEGKAGSTRLGRKHPALPDPDLRLQPPELGEDTFLLCKPPSLWHSVTLPKDEPPWFVPDLSPECHSWLESMASMSSSHGNGRRDNVLRDVSTCPVPSGDGAFQQGPPDATRLWGSSSDTTSHELLSPRN